MAIILNSILLVIGSQCSLRNTGDICSHFLVFVVILAAAFKIRWCRLGSTRKRLSVNLKQLLVRLLLWGVVFWRMLNCFWDSEGVFGLSHSVWDTRCCIYFYMPFWYNKVGKWAMSRNSYMNKEQAISHTTILQSSSSRAELSVITYLNYVTLQLLRLNPVTFCRKWNSSKQCRAAHVSSGLRPGSGM